MRCCQCEKEEAKNLDCLSVFGVFGVIVTLAVSASAVNSSSSRGFWRQAKFAAGN